MTKHLARCRPSWPRPLLRSCCFYSSAPSSPPPAPPLLLKLRGDLKTAMKAKDTNRLNVLRGILGEVSNVAKSSSPVKSDLQLLALLRKEAAAGRATAEEASKGGRADITDNENAQVAVMEEYAAGVETLSDNEIRESIVSVMQDMSKAGEETKKGTVLKKLLGPGGILEGKPVERSVVADLVGQATGS
ncbi:MAG: hypothetical protein M1828_006764 [Chrysothrix sp. TS-e1954]|nr:MAG: hypothetical protein M1828_006764 [Chrysothrix sp. TS-e1954]